MTKSKAFKAAVAKIEEGKFYTPTEAVALAKETGSANFDSTVEVALKLAVDPIHHKETLLHLQEGLAKLCPNQREALWLIDVAGYSIAHVAQQEGVQPGTIKSRRARARQALRENMGESVAPE